VFSGRISAEVVVKVARMRIPFLLSNAAPTSLGRDLAEELGLTALGFVREGRFNLYTHPERILMKGPRA
jgi:FdhD protein